MPVATSGRRGRNFVITLKIFMFYEMIYLANIIAAVVKNDQVIFIFSQPVRQLHQLANQPVTGHCDIVDL